MMNKKLSLSFFLMMGSILLLSACVSPQKAVRQQAQRLAPHYQAVITSNDGRKASFSVRLKANQAVFTPMTKVTLGEFLVASCPELGKPLAESNVTYIHASLEGTITLFALHFSRSVFYASEMVSAANTSKKHQKLIESIRLATELPAVCSKSDRVVYFRLDAIK